MKAGLYLCKTPGKNWGLHAVDMPVEVYIALKRAVFNDFFDKVHPFIQSDSDPLTPFWKQIDKMEKKVSFDNDYLFVEFWTDNQAMILDKVQEFAYDNGVELLLEDF